MFSRNVLSQFFMVKSKGGGYGKIGYSLLSDVISAVHSRTKQAQTAREAQEPRERSWERGCDFSEIARLLYVRLYGAYGLCLPGRKQSYNQKKWTMKIDVVGTIANHQKHLRENLKNWRL